MSKKNLLNESQVRQFMKLASLQPLASGFVGGLSEGGDNVVKEDEEDLEERQTRPPGGDASHGRGDDLDPLKREQVSTLGEEAPPEEELEFAADDLEGDSPEEDEEAVVDLDVAADEEGAMEPEGAEGAMVDVAQFMDLLKTALETAVAEVTGEPTEVEVADDVVDVEDEVEADAPGAEEMEMDVDMSAEEEMPLEEDTTNELVERITKRVAARILKSALAKK